ncbi:MAG: zinc-dependent metalloprotease, partial [Gemmatimonadota bacterium]
GEEEPAAEEQAEDEEAGDREADQEKAGDYEDFDDLVADAEAHEGFLDLYVDDDRLFVAVPRDRLGEDFLMEYKIARGAGANFLFGGLMLSFEDPAVVAVEKRGGKLYLVQRPHRFTAEDDQRAAEAVDLTFSSSVLQSAEIRSVRDDSAWVAEVSGWFVSDLSGISESVEEAVGEDDQPGSARLEKRRSHLESVEAFPDNVNVEARLTFTPGEAVSWPSVPDGRYLPLTLHYTLARLPDPPMEPRPGDDRVGYFWNARKDFSQTDSTFFLRQTRRWRLERGERVDDRWRPEEPVTYYIDPNVPEEYREPMKEGVLAWNEAFEAAGWVDAIRVEDLPDGADPDDIRYPTLRWNVSDQPSYGAIGPSVVDPRTGEILDADILFEASMFQGTKQQWRDFVDPVTAGEALQRSLGTGPYARAWAEDGGRPASGARGVELPGFAGAMAEQGALVRAAMLARGRIAPDEPVPEEFVDQFVTWVTMHEVGHTLGLQHNFRSSASTPFDRLHEESWTARNGVASSVMEYPSVNLAPEGEETGHWWSPGPGSYDRWAISVGYTPDPERARELAREAARKGHLFGNEAGGPGAMDPSINIWDLGDDPLAWGRQRTGIVRDLWRELPGYALDDGDRYHDLTVAFQSLMNQYVQALAPAVKYLGGTYMNRDHVGDPDGRLPYEPVDVDEQREALDLLVDRVLAAGALDVPRGVLERLAPNRWTHWGTTNSFDGRLDYPWREQVADLQATLLGELLHPWRLARIRDAEARWGDDRVVGIPELAGRLSDAVWSELDGAGDIPARRRDLQRAWIDAMTDLVVAAPERTPSDARSVARVELRRVDDRIADRLEASGGRRAGGDIDAYTAAHLEESRARIREALEAGLEIQR